MKNLFFLSIASLLLSFTFSSNVYAQKTFVPKGKQEQTPKTEIVKPGPERKTTPAPKPLPSKNSKVETLPNMANLLTIAQQHIGVPYKWGGSTTQGFDCSGYVQYVFKNADHNLSRTTSTQVNEGKKVCVRKVQKGDLVFFGEKKRDIDHVGLVVSKKGEPLQMIHASSSKGVMITNVEASTYWKPKLQKARRVLDKYALKMVNAKSEGQLKRAARRYLKKQQG
ncbi:MAG: C40 family peptidase [Chitinophagales bacterium]